MANKSNTYRQCKFGYDKEMKTFAQNKKTGETSEKFKHEDEDKDKE